MVAKKKISTPLEAHRKRLRLSPVYAKRVRIDENHFKALRTLSTAVVTIKRRGWDSKVTTASVNRSGPISLCTAVDYSAIINCDRNFFDDQFKIVKYYVNKAAKEASRSKVNNLFDYENRKGINNSHAPLMLKVLTDALDLCTKDLDNIQKAALYYA